MIENDKINKTAITIATVTLLSRVTGYIRDLIFASQFGINNISDIFIAAFKIPNLFKHILGENSLTPAFIPIFISYIERKKYNSAYILISSLAKILFLFLFLISFLGILFTPSIVTLITPGFSKISLESKLMIKLVRIMFPFIIFIGICALCTGILNSLGHFITPAISPIILNITMIASLLISIKFFSIKSYIIICLSISVILAGLLQFLLQAIAIIKKNIYLWNYKAIWHPKLEIIGITMLPIIIGAIAYQINIFIGISIASYLAEGSVTSLYFADRIVQFPIGIFAYAIATATLPTLSKQILNKNKAGEIFAHAINLLFFITIPSMTGIIIFRVQIVEILLMRGEFNNYAVALTSEALLYYAIGLWSYSAVKIVISVFFAFRNTITPVKITSLSIGINIILSIVLVNFLGHCGLALANSIASIINLVLLIFNLNKKIILIPWKNITNNLFKIIICNTLMTLGVLTLKFFLTNIINNNILLPFINLLLCIITAIVIFMFSAHSIKLTQYNQIISLISKFKKYASPKKF